MRKAVFPALLMLALLPAIPAFAQASAKPPPQAEWDKVTADITGADAVARDVAVVQVEAWIKGGWVSQDIWRKWLPALVKAGKHQDVADIANLAILGRAGPDAITVLLDARFKALLALNKPNGAEELLQTAKSYYNVCDVKYQGTNAVTFVTQALAKARPGDAEIVRKFRAEQTAAAAAGATPDGTTPSILSTVKIDPAYYQATIDGLKDKTKFTDKIAYADLLLVIDKGADAEPVFRDLYQTATTQEDLAAATEGLAKSLRAQDGNPTRANMWMDLIKKQNATQPSNLPTAAAVKAAAGGTTAPPAGTTRPVTTRGATKPPASGLP